MDPPSPALEGTSELLVQGQGPVRSLGRAATLAVAVAPTGTSPPPPRSQLLMSLELDSTAPKEGLGPCSLLGASPWWPQGAENFQAGF